MPWVFENPTVFLDISLPTCITYVNLVNVAASIVSRQLKSVTVYPLLQGKNMNLRLAILKWD